MHDWAETMRTVSQDMPERWQDTKQKLTQLKVMLDEGLITQAEYESKKAEILAGR